MDNKKIIGNRINSALALRNKKQIDLATDMGMKKAANTISYFCKGDRTPNTLQLKEIAKILNVSSDYLLGLTDIPSMDVKVREICNYTGLSEKAIDKLNSSKHNEIISQFIENANFDEIIRILSLGKRNQDLLNPSGASIFKAIQTKVNGTDNPLGNDGLEIVLAIGESGLAPVYKQQLTEAICKLFDEVSKKGE